MHLQYIFFIRYLLKSHGMNSLESTAFVEKISTFGELEIHDFATARSNHSVAPVQSVKRTKSCLWKHMPYSLGNLSFNWIEKESEKSEVDVYCRGRLEIFYSLSNYFPQLHMFKIE